MGAIPKTAFPLFTLLQTALQFPLLDVF